MARTQKDLLSRLADAGEEAIQRLGDSPGADRFVGALTSMRDRIDELTKKVRGIDALEARIVELERQVEKLGGRSSGSGGRASSKSSGSSSKSSGARSGSSSKKSSASSGSSSKK